MSSSPRKNAPAFSSAAAIRAARWRARASSRAWRLTAFATRRAEGHHLYFRAALSGARGLHRAVTRRTQGTKVSQLMPLVCIASYFRAAPTNEEIKIGPLIGL